MVYHKKQNPNHIADVSSLLITSTSTFQQQISLFQYLSA